MNCPVIDDLSILELQNLLNACDGSFNASSYAAFAFATVGTSYPISKFVNAVLSFKSLNKMSNFATAKVGKDVRVLALPESSCYSYDDWYSGMNIRLGRTFYVETFNDHNAVSITEIRSKYKRIASIYYGAFYHELFHVMYTPFRYAQEQTTNCPVHFKEFAHRVSNTLEDITAEGTGCNRYPDAKPFIEALASCFKEPIQLDFCSEAITKEPDSPSTMLAYLLLFCRDTDMTQFPDYKIWNDNKEFIEWGVYKCINTIDPYLRIRRQLSFALELYKILDMKEPSKDNIEEPDMSKMQSESNGIPNKGSGSLGDKVTEVLNNLTDVAKRGPQQDTKPEETDKDIKQPEELQVTKAQRGDGSAPPEGSLFNADLTQEGITILANDDPVSHYSHYTDKLNKYVDTTKYLPNYNKLLDEIEPLIRETVSIIRKMIATNNSSWNHYQMSGKLDSSTFYKKGNYKIFKKRNAPSIIADLVFAFAVDLSGSTKGEKAFFAGIALIALCEALNRLHIPFSVDGFTEGNAAVTVSLKDYNESYDSVKTNMTLFTEQFRCRELSTWCGNIDEVNLQYISQKLMDRPEKDKVLVVISDGATCGSWKDLKQTAENIEKRGVTVLGIGLFDDNVKDIYKNHMIIKTRKDLEGLGYFLNKYLIGKIFK